MNFNIAEKLAIVKAIDQVISADKELDNEEIHYLKHLMKVLDFDIPFLQEARKMDADQTLVILGSMNESKKNALKVILSEMAGADGEVDPQEKKVISFFSKIGIGLPGLTKNKGHFDISDIYFESTNHLLYNKGEEQTPLPKKEKIAIKIENSIDRFDVFSVTSFNLDEEPAMWGSNVKMASKQMKVIESKASKTILRGFGEDNQAIGDPEGTYSNFGVSIIHPKNKIERIILHRHDRNENIEYLK